MALRTFAKYLSDTLTIAGWPGLVLDEQRQSLKCPKGDILLLKKGEYHLNFISYNSDKKEFNQRETYGAIVFPKKFNIRKLIYFRPNGNFKLSREGQFKNIVNPLHKSVKKIKLIDTSGALKFHGGVLMLPIPIFKNAMKDAEFVYNKGVAYRNSTENYLSNVKSHSYSKNVKKRTTYLEKGEFNFLVDRFYLKSKNNRNDFLKYLNADDISAIEALMVELLKYGVFSDDFLKKLNEYFIKEKLKDIIELGKQILSLKSTDMNTLAAKEIIAKLGLTEVHQLEALWQSFFEKNLLYLIFTYKKIFPKVELNDIEGDKKYPDFIGINHYNGLDVIEIKTHLKNALLWDNSHQNFYFSPEMSKAIVQTTNYMDSIIRERFKNPEDQQKITNFVDEENLYHPRGIIIISSQERLTNKTGEEEKLKRDFTKLRNSVHNIEILTFDEILNIADEYITNISPIGEAVEGGSQSGRDS